MTEITTVVWRCDLKGCDAESDELRPEVTFSWDYDDPPGWVTFQEPTEHQWPPSASSYVSENPFPYSGLGNDPRLVPEWPHKWHFCCEEHKRAWLAEREAVVNAA